LAQALAALNTSLPLVSCLQTTGTCIMNTPYASSISLAADVLAAPLGLQPEEVVQALSVPEMAKAQCINCERHGCPLNLHVAAQTDSSRSSSHSGNRSRSRSRSRSGGRSESGMSTGSDRMSTGSLEAIFSVLCDVCCPEGEGVQLRRYARH